MFSGVSSLLLATAGWLNRLFASAAWLFFCTANWLAAIATAVLSHHSCEKTLDTSAASSSVASVNNFCTANGLNRLFATATWLFFCTANWLASIASAVLSHHSCEKTLDTSAASSSVASVNNFCTADRLNWLFTAASWLNFCTTNWLASIASISFTNIENAERICVG